MSESLSEPKAAEHLTVTEAAIVLGITTQRIRSLMTQGYLGKPEMVMGKWLVSRRICERQRKNTDAGFRFAIPRADW